MGGSYVPADLHEGLLPPPNGSRSRQQASGAVALTNVSDGGWARAHVRRAARSPRVPRRPIVTTKTPRRALASRFVRARGGGEGEGRGERGEVRGCAVGASDPSGRARSNKAPAPSGAAPGQQRDRPPSDGHRIRGVRAGGGGDDAPASPRLAPRRARARACALASDPPDGATCCRPARRRAGPICKSYVLIEGRMPPRLRGACAERRATRMHAPIGRASRQIRTPRSYRHTDLTRPPIVVVQLAAAEAGGSTPCRSGVSVTPAV
eukprot:1684132-Prymnesium_polylepis.2